MPKKIEFDDELEEESEEDDEEFDEDMRESSKPVMKQKVMKKVSKEPKAPKRRFAAFANPQRVGITDVETNEVVAEGEYLVPQALAELLERMERLENLIGNFVER